MSETMQAILTWAGWLPVAGLVAVASAAAYRWGKIKGRTSHREQCWITQRIEREWEERQRYTR